MMNDFLQQSGPMPPPFAMEQLRHDLPVLQSPAQRTPSPGWAAEFDPGVQARMEAAFAASNVGGAQHGGFSPAEFARFQNPTQRTSSPVTHTPLMNGYQRPMGLGYMSGMAYGMKG